MTCSMLTDAYFYINTWITPHVHGGNRRLGWGVHVMRDWQVVVTGVYISGYIGLTPGWGAWGVYVMWAATRWWRHGCPCVVGLPPGGGTMGVHVVGLPPGGDAWVSMCGRLPPGGGDMGDHVWWGCHQVVVPEVSMCCGLPPGGGDIGVHVWWGCHQVVETWVSMCSGAATRWWCLRCLCVVGCQPGGGDIGVQIKDFLSHT